MTLLGKVLRDFRATPGRSALVLGVLTLSLTALALVLGAYSILTREVTRAYVETKPATVTLDVASVTPEALEFVRAQSGVLAVDQRRTVHGRFRAAPDAPAQTLLLFVLSDFEHMPLALLGHERGARIPPRGTILVERSALFLLDGDIGTRLFVEVPGGVRHEVAVSGVTHDPALAPARTHAALYAYASAETAQDLGISPGCDELRLRMPEALGRAEIQGRARALAQELEARGLASVHAISVPPLGKHPHESQMQAVLALLLGFSVLIVLMGSLVAATLLEALLFRQTREIAISKTLGATAGQLRRAWFGGLFLLAFAAAALALPLGLWGAQAWAREVSGVLNFDLETTLPSPAILALELLVGLLVPVLVAAPGISRALGRTVIEVLVDQGAQAPDAAPSRRSQLAAADSRALRLHFGERRVVPLSLAFSLRELGRARRRFVLSLMLLSVAGGTFVSAVNLRGAWDVWIGDLSRTHRYDLEMQVLGTTAAQDFARRLQEDGVAQEAEVFVSLTAAVTTPGEVPVAHGYPDDAHGTFHLVAAPPGSKMVELSVCAGRLPAPGEADAVAINQMLEGASELDVGDALTVAVGDVTATYRIVGKVEEVGVGAQGHVTPEGLARLARPDQPSRALIRVRAGGPAGGKLARALDRRAQADGLPVLGILPLAVFQNAMVAHLDLLIGALSALSVLTGIVGALGLGATLGAQTAARARQFAVLRSLGAVPAQIHRLVQAEGVVLALCSFPLAGLVALAATRVLGGLVGQMSFRLPLPFEFSFVALLGWAPGAVGLALLATWLPARAATRMSVKAALDAT